MVEYFLIPEGGGGGGGGHSTDILVGMCHGEVKMGGSGAGANGVEREKV